MSKAAEFFNYLVRQSNAFGMKIYIFKKDWKDFATLKQLTYNN